MSSLSISRAWDEAKEIIGRDGRLLVAVALALVVFPTVILGLIVPTDPAEGGLSSALLQVAVALIAMIAQLALIRLAIGPGTTVGAAISHGVRRFPALFVAMLLLLFLIICLMIPLILILGAMGTVDVANPSRSLTGAAVGVSILIVLGLVALSVKFLLTAPVASAEGVGPIAILKRSWSLTNGQYWKLLGFLLLLLIVAIILMAAAGAVGGILGALISPDLETFSIGALVLAVFTGVAQGAFTILSAVMMARVYVQLSGRDSLDVTVPKTGT